MMKPTGGLGRGLGALLPTAVQPRTTTPSGEEKIVDLDLAHGLKIIDINPNQIVENPHQPRKHFSPEELHDLGQSIKEHGILQPLVVTKKGPAQYELIAGERRLRASREIGLEKVPVIVRDEISDQKKLELAIIENTQRQELSAIEEARAYQALIELFGLTQQQVSEKVGKSRSVVANTIRLLDLDEDMLNAVEDGRLSRSHARTLLAEDDRQARRKLFEAILGGGVTVREAEAYAYSSARKMAEEKDANVLAIEKELREKLGTKVQIQMHEGRGKINISFYSRAELKKLIEKLVE